MNARPYPATKAWWAVGVLVLTALISFLDRQALSLLVDPVRAELGISEVQIGLLQGLSFAVLYAVAGLPIGRMVDRGHRKTLLVVGVIVWSAATAAGGYATGFWQLFGSRVLVGVGEATLVPVAISMIADMLPPERRGRAVAVFLMGQVLGGGASILMAGQIIDLVPTGAFEAVPLLVDLSAWRVVLVVCGLLGVPIVALLLTVEEPPRSAIRGHDASLQSPPAFRATVSYLRMRADVFLPFYLAFALVALASYGASAWIPTLLIRKHGLSPGEVGAMIGTLAAVAGALGTSAGGLLADTLERRGLRLMKLGGATLAAALCLPTVLVAVAPSALLAVSAATFLKFFFPFAGALCITTIQDAFPGHMRGFGTSLVAFCNTLLGFTLGPLLIAVATESIFGDPTAVGRSIALVIGPAIVASSGLYYLAWRNLRRRVATDAELRAVMALERAAQNS